MVKQLESKSLPFAGVGFDEVDGIVEGFAAVCGNWDDANERIVSGAFARTLSDYKGSKPGIAKLPMGLDHEIGFGVTVDAAEVARSDLPSELLAEAPDATGGLWAKGQVVLSDENIRRLEQLRGSPRKPRMSITYRVIRDTKAQAPNGRDGRQLDELALHEWGPQLRRVAVNRAAQVTYAKSTEEAVKALAGSYEDLGQRVTEAVVEADLFPSASGVYCSATFPESVIVNVYQDGEPDRHYRVNYATVDGAIALGDVSEVELTTAVTEKANAEMGHLMVIERYAAELKAGRVLSQKNLDALDAAIDELQRIRKAATGTEPDGSEQKNEPDGKAAEDAPREQRLERALREQTLITMMEV